MKRLRICFLILVLSFPAYAGTGRDAQTAIVKNLVNALNYSKYEQFIKDGSPEWRKKMNRSSYNNLTKQMINYIGHIVSWKPLNQKIKGKVMRYTYRLTGDSESIGLVMAVDMYVYKDKLVVNNVSFVKR